MPPRPMDVQLLGVPAPARGLEAGPSSIGIAQEQDVDDFAFDPSPSRSPRLSDLWAQAGEDEGALTHGLSRTVSTTGVHQSRALRVTASPRESSDGSNGDLPPGLMVFFANRGFLPIMQRAQLPLRILLSLDVIIWYYQSFTCTTINDCSAILGFVPPCVNASVINGTAIPTACRTRFFAMSPLWLFSIAAFGFWGGTMKSMRPHLEELVSSSKIDVATWAKVSKWILIALIPYAMLIFIWYLYSYVVSAVQYGFNIWYIWSPVRAFGAAGCWLILYPLLPLAMMTLRALHQLHAYYNKRVVRGDFKDITQIMNYMGIIHLKVAQFGVWWQPVFMLTTFACSFLVFGACGLMILGAVNVDAKFLIVVLMAGLIPLVSVMKAIVKINSSPDDLANALLMSTEEECPLGFSDRVKISDYMSRRGLPFKMYGVAVSKNMFAKYASLIVTAIFASIMSHVKKSVGKLS